MGRGEALLPRRALSAVLQPNTAAEGLFRASFLNSPFSSSSCCAAAEPLLQGVSFQGDVWGAEGEEGGEGKKIL